MDKSKSPSKRSPILLPVLNHHRYRSSSTLKSSLKHTSLSPDRKKINRPENSPIKNNYRRSISPVISPYKAQVSYNLSDLNFGKCLGRGKQGRVVLAQMDQKEYAVKILQKDEKKTGELEWNILTQLNSPFCVDSYGKIDDADNLYLLLEHMNGGDLFHYIRKHKLKPKQIEFLAAEIVLALEHLHSKGIIYRDLKPENIMLDKTGHIKLVDFGLSKLIGEERAKTTCGSAEYMAPEILRRKGYGFGADWWSLGVLIYELLCGATPFKADNTQEVYQNILSGEIHFTRSIDNTCKDLIRNLLTQDPNLRLTSQHLKTHPFFRNIDWRSLPSKHFSPFFNTSLL